MANSFTREFETLEALIEMQSYDDEMRKWPVVAALAVVDILHDYWELVENNPDSIDDDFAAQTLETIQDTFHSLIVHQELPLTEEQAIAMEDQAVAALRDDLEGLGKKLNLDLVIENLDEKLRDVFSEKKTEEKEEKDGDSI